MSPTWFTRVDSIGLIFFYVWPWHPIHTKSIQLNVVECVNLLHVLLQAPLNSKINEFGKFYRIYRNSHHWAFSCADPCEHQGLNNKMENIFRGLINGTQVNIFWVISFNMENLKYLRNIWITCTLDRFCLMRLSLVSHRGWAMAHSRPGHLCCCRKVRALLSDAQMTRLTLFWTFRNWM